MAEPTLDEICTMLTSSDPTVRDETGYTLFYRHVRDGQADGGLRALGDRMSEQLAHSETHARTFATLGLTWVILRDEVAAELDAADVLRWLDAFTTWYSGETDLRGHDETLGWLHAIAHGSDTIEAFGRSRHLDSTDLVALLDLVRLRLMTPTDYLFAHFEDDRVASAVAVLLHRPELTVDDATGWLRRIPVALSDGTPGPIPAAISNTIRTLTSLYVANQRGVKLYVHPGQQAVGPTKPPYTAEIAEAIADCLRTPMPYLG